MSLFVPVAAVVGDIDAQCAAMVVGGAGDDPGVECRASGRQAEIVVQQIEEQRVGRACEGTAPQGVPILPWQVG